MARRRSPRPKRRDDARAASKRARRERARAEREATARARRRRAAVKRWAIITAVVAAVGGLGFFIASGSGGGVSFSGDLVTGGAIEEMRLPELEGDGEITYAQLSDKPLVLNFFASWCPNCIAEMPRFETLSEEIGADVRFLGVSQSDPPGASIEVVEETGVTYPTAIDERGNLFRGFGGVGMPVTVFVQPGGGIAEIATGELSDELLRGKVAQHFGVAV